MKTTDENINISKPITIRFKSVMDYILTNREMFKIASLAELSELLDMPPTRYHGIGKDNRNVTLPNCVNLCKTFKVSSEWLLLGSGSMFKESVKTKKPKVKMVETDSEIVIRITK